MEDAMNMVVRPASLMTTKRDLSRLLQNLEKQGFLQRLRSGGVETITVPVQVGSEFKDVVFGPSDKGVAGKATFSYLLQAELRALATDQKEGEKRQERIKAAKELSKQADQDLTWSQVAQGQQGGTIYLWLTAGRAALLSVEILAGNNAARITILETNYGLPEWYPFTVSLPSFEPLRGRWPHGSYLAAIQHQMEREEEKRQAAAERASVQERLEPFNNLATLPYHWEEQGFTRLVRGEDGTVVIRETGFEWNGKKGFIALAVTRRGNELLIKQLDSELSFPAELVGEPLPAVTLQEQADGALKMRFNLPAQDQISPETRNALRMLQVIFNRRLVGELKAVTKDSVENHAG